jgi:glycosyltransferase involved in cell wall biosynthesis
MFPQWIIDQGIIRERSIAAYFFKYYEKINYEASDCIGLQSQANLDIFTEKFPFYKNLKILRNWSALSALNNKNYNKEFLNKYNLSDKVILFYGGNTGHAQDMENVMRLAKNMALIDDAHFLIIGQGDEFDLIQSLKTKWRLRNVTILPAVSQVEFRSILAVTDIGLFSLAYNHSAHNFPGKLLGYMVESKPILGSVNPGNDLSSIINNSNAGFVFTNGEDRLLADAAISLVKDKELRHSMGKKSRDLLIREFSVQSAVQNILESVKSNKYQ